MGGRKKKTQKAPEGAPEASTSISARLAAAPALPVTAPTSISARLAAAPALPVSAPTSVSARLAAAPALPVPQQYSRAPATRSATAFVAPVVRAPSPRVSFGTLPAPAAVDNIGTQFGQITIEDVAGTSTELNEEPPLQEPPISKKGVRFPRRPNIGRTGRHCLVRANHFFTDLPTSDLHQYDVTITPEVTSRIVNRAVIDRLVHLYRDSMLGQRLPAYDGRKSLYTAGPLPFQINTFQIELAEDDDDHEGDNARRRMRAFQVVIKFAARADLEHLGNFLQGLQADSPQEALQVLDIVLRELPTRSYTPVARSFYSPSLGRTENLGEGLQGWRGFYQSIRPTQMGLSLNVDMSSTAFIEALPIIAFVSQLGIDNRRPMRDGDRVKMKKALSGVKIEVNHRGNMRRKYRITGITSEPTSLLRFKVDEQTDHYKSVMEYFLDTYQHVIQFPWLPCLQVGTRDRQNYLPMEVCKIVSGQRYPKRLNDKQITALLKATCQKPAERQAVIFDTVRQNAYDKDPFAQEFGIKIKSALVQVEARVLPTPTLKYHDSGRVRECIPKEGQWNMLDKKLLDGGIVKVWACINFSPRVNDHVAAKFCRELVEMCNQAGMHFSREMTLSIKSARAEDVEATLRRLVKEVTARTRGKNLDLLLAILPDSNGPLYGELKRLCETELGFVSQCCLTKHVCPVAKQQYLANLALKINAKVGGTNTVLLDALNRRMPRVGDKPTIIFGADVTHPHPGEDSCPSIAAVVASQDWPQVSKYTGLVCAQAHRQELISDLFTSREDPKQGRMFGGMVRDHLLSFMQANGQRKPERIIFYRDGVSEGQFYQVLLNELDAIRKACSSLEANYQPPVTFVVVQKRHHTRLFPGANCPIDRSGNILPGTVVDTKICHPTEFDFYLCSHSGIQGTSRPTHYHVLWDDNKFTADELQSLTYNLCYTYARCTRSVSIVPPAYYAHLAAFRARFYMGPESPRTVSENESVNGQNQQPAPARAPARAAGAPTGPPARAAPTRTAPEVRPLPSIARNVQKVMFYC
ncbi:hypothetical protein R1sor_024523 [Riccia sorocarpa]|uniref:Uncharacterized protein n=1 Tax=Riccia sorocarpa TaxID=122646 RepID=A0ABD3GT00_9MARC